MKNQDLDRVRFVTQHFNDLQGLRYGVPLGLVTLSVATIVSQRLLTVSLLAGALLLMLGARLYYRNTLGEVETEMAGPAGDLCAVASFSPVGPVSRIQGFRQVTPLERHVLLNLGVAVLIFASLQALPPNVLIRGSDSLLQAPQIVREPAYSKPVWIGEGPPIMLRWPTWRGDGSMSRAVIAQLLYAVYGSIFLSLWLWRKGRPSQIHHLVLAVLLLALAALGTFLGYLVRYDGSIVGVAAPLLPALVYPGLALLLCGSAMIVTGLLDHWQLVRGMKPAAGQEEER